MFEDDGLEFVDGEEERKFLYRNLSREDLINRLAESEHHVDAIVSAIRETMGILSDVKVVRVRSLSEFRAAVRLAVGGVPSYISVYRDGSEYVLLGEGDLMPITLRGKWIKDSEILGYTKDMEKLGNLGSLSHIQ